MTNEELLQDLKQFVAATVSQSAADIKSDMNKRFEAVDNRFGSIDRRFDAMDKRFDDVYQRFDDIDDQLNEIQNAVGTELQDHEKRLRRFEARAA
jgi:flagellar capping protein FliD